MNKKYIIIGAVVAAIALLAMCGKCEAQEVVNEKNWELNTEVGYYEKRISDDFDTTVTADVAFTF